MHALLAIETRAFHADADAGWRALMTPDVTVGAYIDQLTCVYGFEGPLEAALAYTPKLELVIDVHAHYRAGFIAQDLIALGMRPSEVAHLPQQRLAPFASPLEALGWMYVVERDHALRDELRRHLWARLPHARDASVYLSTSDGHREARWQEFTHALDRAARTRRMVDEIVNGARAGFRAWREWRQGSVRLNAG
jgi:heme oxygenase